MPLLKKLSEYLGDSNEKLAPFKDWADKTAGAMEGFAKKQEAVNAALKDYRASSKKREGRGRDGEKTGAERFAKGKIQAPNG